MIHIQINSHFCFVQNKIVYHKTGVYFSLVYWFLVSACSVVSTTVQLMEIFSLLVAVYWQLHGAYFWRLGPGRSRRRPDQRVWRHQPAEIREAAERQVADHPGRLDHRADRVPVLISSCLCNCLRKWAHNSVSQQTCGNRTCLLQTRRLEPKETFFRQKDLVIRCLVWLKSCSCYFQLRIHDNILYIYVLGSVWCAWCREDIRTIRRFLATLFRKCTHTYQKWAFWASDWLLLLICKFFHLKSGIEYPNWIYAYQWALWLAERFL